MAVDISTINLPDPETLEEDIHLMELGHLFLEMWVRERALYAKYGDTESDRINDRLSTVTAALDEIGRLISRERASSFEGLCVKMMALMHARGGEDGWFVPSPDSTSDFNLLASIMTDIREASWMHGEVGNRRAAA